MPRRLAPLLAVGLLLASRTGTATKPCPPSPCTPKGVVDLAKCREISDWIATGTISKVVHHPADFPLLKDFAEFTFTVSKWEKGTGKSDQTIDFRVGWCDNSQTLPKETKGLFTCYGPTLPKDPALPNRYFYFEPVTDSKKER